MAKSIIGSGSVSILDMNDAIISGEAPSNPIKGTLWIDTSKTPNVLYMWNGSAWIKQQLSVGDLDPDFSDTVEDLKNQLGNISNDGIINNGEKLNIKLLLVEITGQNVTGNSLPTLAQIDEKAGGQVYMARTGAKEAGVPTTNASYKEFETAYNSLKSYLESLSPRPWLATGDTRIDPTTWLSKWNTYYEKLAKLQVTTNDYLSNSLKPGEDYNGTTITEEEGVVVLRGDQLVKTTLNATDGIAIRRRANTSSAWTDMFYVDTNGYLNAKGLRVSNDSQLGSTSVSNVVSNANAGAQANATISDMANDNKITASEKLSLKKDLEAIVAEKPLLVEEAGLYGVAVTNYNSAYNDLYNYMNPLLSDLTTTSGVDGRLMRLYFSEYSEQKANLQKAISQAGKNKVDSIKVGGTNLFKGYGQEEIRLPDYQSTGSFKQFYDCLTIDPAEHLNEEFTVSFYAKSPNGTTQIQVYNSNGNPRYFYFTKVLDTALGNEWKYYTYTFKNTDRGASYTASNKLEIYAKDKMGVLVKKIKIEKGNKASDWNPSFEDVQKQITDLDNELGSIEEEVAAVDQTLTDISSDSKMTPSEKLIVKKDLEEIIGEKPTIEAQATAYGISTEKVNYTTSYTTLYNYVNPLVSNLTTTSTVVGSTLRSYFKDYYTKKAILLKKISDTAKGLISDVDTKVNNISVGGRNLIRKANLGTSNSSGTFDDATNTWTITATAGAGGSWGCGLVVKNKDAVIPYGKTYVLSFEILVPRACTWNTDVNNYPVTGTAWASNDNDLTSARSTSSKTLEANRWIKCWSKYSNTNTNNTSKLDLYDASNFGVVMTNETSNMTYQIRNVMGEIGTIPSEWTPAPEDIRSQIDAIETELGELEEDVTRVDGSLADMASDSKLTPSEKIIIKKDLEEIVGEKSTIEAQATKYNITTEKTNYNTSYTTLYNYVNPLLSSLTTTSAVNGSTMRSYFKDYYAKKAILLKAISDSAKGLYDGINVGDKNLLKKSGVSKTTTTYNIADYYLTETLNTGDTVTLSLKGTLGADRTYFGIYNSGGNVSVTSLLPADKGADGVFRKTFNWNVGSAANTFIRVYHMVSSSTSSSTVEWVKLVRGNKTTSEWSAAPEDMGIGGRNLIKGTKNFTLEIKGSSTDTGQDREGWKNTGSWTFAKDSEGFTVASKSQTGLTSNNIPSLYSTKYPVKTGDEIILSCYVKVDNTTAWDGAKAPYIFEVYNASGTRVQYQDVSITLNNTNKPTVVNGQWFHFYSKHTVTVADAATVGMRATLFRNGSIHIKKCKVEFGNFNPTDWTPAPEDTDSRIDTVVDEEGNIKAEEIAYGFSVNQDASQILSRIIDLTGKVTFSSYIGVVKDDNGNPITNADQEGYDANFPKWLGTDGNYYRPHEFVDGVYIQEGDKTVINGASIATGSVQADKINFKNAVVEKEVYDSSGSLVSTEKTFEIKADGSVFSAGTFQSLDYQPQTKGWIISESGEAEFNNAYFRGDVLLPNAGVTSATDSNATTEQQNNQVRIWAGTSFDKKEEAPFRVTHDGTLHASQGYFQGLFNGNIEVGNIRITDDDTKSGDAIITIADHSGVNKVSIGESAAEFKTPTYFGTTSGRFLTIDSTNQRLSFGKSDFLIDYKNNTVRMKDYSIAGGSGLIFTSNGSPQYDFQFKTTDGDSHVLVDGTLHVNHDIEYENIVTIRRVADSGNEGVDYVFL